MFCFLLPLSHNLVNIAKRICLRPSKISQIKSEKNFTLKTEIFFRSQTCFCYFDNMNIAKKTRHNLWIKVCRKGIMSWTTEEREYYICNFIIQRHNSLDINLSIPAPLLCRKLNDSLKSFSKRAIKSEAGNSWQLF